MTLPLPIAILIVFVAGIALSTQAPLNAALARTLTQPLAAVAVSFGVGFIVLVILSIAVGGTGPLLQLGQAPGWQLLGGFLGAFYVWAAVWGVPQMGVVTTAAALILGQMAAALVLDRLGLFGLPVQEVSVTRLAAAGLVAAGVVLSRV
jgi:bacterial/archaeal transporter family-2 protein